MIFRNSACTVFEKSIDSTTRLETYDPHQYGSVYCEIKRGIKASGGSAGQSDSLLLLIDGNDVDYVPKVGDIVTNALVTELPSERFTVREVFDARYGTGTSHIEVRAV